MTGPEAEAFDARSIGEVGVPQPVLMENAGRAAASVVQRLWPAGRVVAVIGAGNNGGDALVALRSLGAWGREVRGVLVADRPQADPLAHGWPLEILDDGALDGGGWRELLGGASVVVDGILGTGVRGVPRRRQAEAIGRLNESGRPVLAIDVPSGIDSSTGVVGGAAVRADVTVAFGAPKLGALLHPARALVGRHVVAEIGFPPLPDEAASARLVTPRWARARLPRRGTDTHKNAVGRVTIVAGQVGMAGAAVLAGRAAFRSGAGLVRLCSVPENREVIQAAVPEALFVDASDRGALESALAASDAVAAGPGLGTGEAAAGMLSSVLSTASAPLVLDADGLNLAAAAPGRFDLPAAGGRRPVLLTPHPGEMMRLRPAAPEAVPDRVGVARAAAEQLGCTVLLKGAPTVVATPDGAVALDTQSSSDLAVAGMGDVLTGVCAGLVAQGLSAEVGACVGLYLTGRAARLAGRGPALTPGDVVSWLAAALTERGEPECDLDLPFVTFDADAPA